MPAAYVVVSSAIVAIGFGHVVGTPRFWPGGGTAALWFASGGIAAMLVGACNLLNLTYGHEASGVRLVSVLANVGLVGFLLALIFVGRPTLRRDPQVFVGLALAATATVLSVA
jgi:hypothetical protein